MFSAALFYLNAGCLSSFQQNELLQRDAINHQPLVANRNLNNTFIIIRGTKVSAVKLQKTEQSVSAVISDVEVDPPAAENRPYRKQIKATALRAMIKSTWWSSFPLL